MSNERLDNIVCHYHLGLPLNPQLVRLEAGGTFTQLSNRGDIYGTILNHNYLQKQKQIALEPFVKTRSPRLLHVRDMYIASAISIIMRNVQAKNGIHTELNGAGLLFNELRGEATPTSGRQAGSLGSVSWWIKDVTYQNLTPYELVEQILTNFWSYLDIPLDFSVYDKFKAFIALSDLDEIDFTKLETLLIYLLNTIDNNFINITKQLRQNLLTKNDLNDLRSRIFLHEIPVSLPELLTEIDNIISAGNLSQQYNYVPSDINIFKWNKYWQSTLPGGGFLLVIFALYAECAFTIASIINGLSEEEQLGLYQDYAKAGDTESRTEIVRHLVWSLDLVNLLAKYSSIVEAKGWLNDIEEELGIYNINLGIISQRITL